MDSFGPIPKKEFVEIAAPPYGEAKKRIRKYDPLWGLKPGEKVKWRVECRANMEGVAIIEAASQEEADALADKLSAADVDWDKYDDDFEIVSVEVEK